MRLIEKLILGTIVTKYLVYDELEEICGREHTECNNHCPVWKYIEYKNKNEYPCPCSGNGQKMAEYISKNLVK